MNSNNLSRELDTTLVLNKTNSKAPLSIKNHVSNEFNSEWIKGK